MVEKKRNLFPLFSLLAVTFIIIFSGEKDLWAENKIESGIYKFAAEITSQAMEISRLEGGLEVKKQKLTELFEENVDTEWMARFVLGRYNRVATSEQKEKYVKLYGTYLINNYIPKFSDYNAQDFEILRIKKVKDNVFIVYLNIIRGGEEPDVRFDYRINKYDKGTYRIADFILEGVSLVSTQRSDFGGLISQKGMDFFISALEKKVNEFLAEN